MRRDFPSVTLPEIYIVRVSETAWEREGRQLGHLDSPINAKGIEQARTAGRVLRKLLGDRRAVCIETSPLGRAGHTAALLCVELGLDPGTIIDSPRLIDYNLGSWQGLTNAEIDTRYPGARLSREKDKWRYIVPSGESYADVHKRAQEWLAGKRRARMTITVTHRMVSRVLQGSYTGATPEEILRRSHNHDCIYKLYDGLVEEIPCDVTRVPESVERRKVPG